MMGFALGLALGIVFALALYLTRVPSCNEDVVLIGSGDFTAGRWSEYTCGTAADNFIP